MGFKEMKEKFIHFYDTKYRKLLIIPSVLLILAVIQIGVQIAVTGDFVNKGVSLSGGSSITFLKEVDSIQLQDQLNQQFPDLDITVRTITDRGATIGIIVESAAQTDTEILGIVKALEKSIGISKQDITIEVTGSSLGRSFFYQTFYSLALAFILMALVVLIYFRNFYPSIAVILAAFSDIVITLSIFNLLGEKLSTAGIAAFLMLVGYAVDDNILLTSHLLKRRDASTINTIKRAFTTAITMVSTALVAILAGLLITNSEIIRQIMLILFIGLIVDLMNTWIQNVGILRWYLDKKHPKVQQ